MVGNDGIAPPKNYFPDIVGAQDYAVQTIKSGAKQFVYRSMPL